MKCLSIKQPWAWAILNAGKDIENRSWKTSHRGPLLIHASQQIDHEGYRTLATMGIQVPNKLKLPLGAIVGQVDVVDCVESSDSRWFSGPVGFVLANPRLVGPVRWQGRLGLFDVKFGQIEAEGSL